MALCASFPAGYMAASALSMKGTVQQIDSQQFAHIDEFTCCSVDFRIPIRTFDFDTVKSSVRVAGDLKQ